MNRLLKWAIAFVSAGTAAAMLCLIKTTPITMSVFFFFGLPCFAVAISIYLSLFIRFLRLGSALIHRR